MMLDLVNAVGVLDGAMVVASDGEGDIRALGLLFLLSGFIFYGVVYMRYRNTDKRHKHESETEATMLDVRASDVHVNTLKGVSNARLRGANNREVRGAANGKGAGSVASGAVNDALRRLPGQPQI